MSSSSHYFRLILYMARMLTLDYLIIPYDVTAQDVHGKSFKRNFKKANDYMDTFNVKHELLKVLTIVMAEDVYYGIERRAKNSSMLQRLPSKYCMITGIEDGIYTFSFDMTYFSGGKSKFKNFPKEFRNMYRMYQETGEPWQLVDTKIGVCFKFREDLVYALPPFVAIIEEVLDLEDLKDLIKSKNRMENFKLLLQKIPFKKEPRSEKDFLISLESVKMFHNNIKAVLPEQIGLISTPMEMEEFNFDRKGGNSSKNSVSELEEEIFSSAGVSSGLFNSGNKSSIGMNRAINTDESMMFMLLRQFERFFNKRLDELTSGTYKFKVMLPDLTVFNRHEMQDRYLKMAQYGFPKSLVATTMGMTTQQLVGLNTLEKEFYNLESALIPLNSSHTQNGNEESGKPQKDENKLSDKGLEAKDGESNDNRAK